MRLPLFEYIRPAGLAECLELLSEDTQTGILAGGTDLVVNMKYGVARPARVLGIRALPELGFVSEQADGSIRIGACVSLADLAQSRLISEKAPALRDACAETASWTLRRRATLGGNLCLPARCWYYNQSRQWRAARGPCLRTGGNDCHAVRGSGRCHALNQSDTAPALTALDARVRLQSRSADRVVPLKDFYRDDGARSTVLAAGELLTEIVLPAESTSGRSAFIKESRRRGIDFAVGTAAARLTGARRKPASVRLVLGALGSRPLVLETAARIVKDAGLSAESIEQAAEAVRAALGTLTNLFTPAGYKRDLAPVLIRRSLQALSPKKTPSRRAG